MSAGKSKKRFGCLTVLLIVVLIIVLACVGLWTLVLHKGPGKAAREIISGPVDPAASSVVEKALIERGVAGAKVVIAPLPDDKGNIVIMVLDPTDGFQPSAGPEGKRQQALNAIKQLVETNLKEKLNLQRVGLEYQENGKAVVALTAPMDALEGLANGKIDDAQFLADVDVKLKDILYVKNLFK
ncbi:MAG TPA: hypothetical protein VGE40_05810 [Bacilli bacterium]